MAGFWKVFYIENERFALDTLRWWPTGPPPRLRKSTISWGCYIWWVWGRLSRPIWGIPGVRAGTKYIFNTPRPPGLGGCGPPNPSNWRGGLGGRSPPSRGNAMEGPSSRAPVSASGMRLRVCPHLAQPRNMMKEGGDRDCRIPRQRQPPSRPCLSRRCRWAGAQIMK